MTSSARPADAAPPDTRSPDAASPGGPGRPPSRSGAERRRVAPRTLALVLAVLLALVLVLSLRTGSTGALPFATVARGLLALCGLGAPLDGHLQTIVEWRLWRLLVGVGVGAALALSGGLLQGVFRNDLASPSIIGVTAGAGLGASIAILALGGVGPLAILSTGGVGGPLLVTLCAMVGAIGAVLLVTLLASSGGRISVPNLLLVGIAVNAVVAGLLSAIQALVLRDELQLAKAMMRWTFGTLDDRAPYHVTVIWSALAVTALVIPFVRVELDLFAAGEEDAQALGVHTQRVKLLALVAAAAAAAAASAVAGQIAFVGLVVPHLLRLLSGRSHRTLLPLCLLGGPVFLMGTDLVQRSLLGDAQLQPGVMMSLLGGPFFLWLLVRDRAAIRGW